MAVDWLARPSGKHLVSVNQVLIRDGLVSDNQVLIRDGLASQISIDLSKG